nr:PAS domain S-box protein [Acidobacteriota bacterium]
MSTRTADLARELARLEEESGRREEQLRAEARVAREELEAVLAGTREACLLLDGEGRCRALNGRALELLGKPREELLGQRPWELLPGLLDGLLQVAVLRAIAERREYELEGGAPGREDRFEYRLLPAPGGLAVFVAAKPQDPRAGQAPRRREERLDLALRAADLGLWHRDLSSDELIWNDRCKELFGLPPESPVTIGVFFDRLHPDDRERSRLAMERSIAEHAAYDIDHRTVAPDGRVRWVRAIGRVFYDSLDRPVGLSGIAADVTERMRAEMAHSELLR